MTNFCGWEGSTKIDFRKSWYPSSDLSTGGPRSGLFGPGAKSLEGCEQMPAERSKLGPIESSAATISFASPGAK